MSVADRLELTDLVARLGRWLDDPDDDDGLRAVYAENAVVHSPRGTAAGFDEVLVLARANNGGDERTHHLTSDVLVDLGIDGDGDRAAVSANLVNVFYRPGESPHRTVGIRYAFSAARTTDGWRFDGARVTPAWFSPQP